MKIKRRERLFLVSYVGHKHKNTLCFGDSVVGTDGSYVNRAKFCSDIEEDSGVKQVCIIGIQEITEQNYKDFIE